MISEAKRKYLKEYRQRPEAKAKNRERRRRDYARLKLLKGGNKNKMFKNKAKPVAPPVDDDFEEEEVDDEDEEVEEIEEETKKIKAEIEKVKAKRKPPVEKPVEEPKAEEPVEEELTEEKVKQILINFEQRLQRIEYNLR